MQFTHVIENDLNPNWNSHRRINVKLDPTKITQYVVFIIIDLRLVSEYLIEIHSVKSYKAMWKSIYKKY